jgi:hypothetical protein
MIRQDTRFKSKMLRIGREAESAGHYYAQHSSSTVAALLLKREAIISRQVG